MALGSVGRVTLLEALKESASDQVLRPRASDGTEAQLVYFAFTDDESAFLSELELVDLVPLLERWCQDRRAEMKDVH